MSIRYVTCLLTAVLLSGCFPEERIWWSPKGDRAVVMLANRTLHLINAQGEIGAALFGGQALDDWGVLTVSWLPDGSGIVCGRTRKIANWEEAKALIPAEEVERVEARLGGVVPSLKGEIAGSADLTSVQSLDALYSKKDQAEFLAGLRLVFQKQREAIEPVLRALPHGVKLLSELTDPTQGFAVRELCRVTLDDSEPMESQTLVASLLALPMMPRVSPRHAVMAYVELREGGGDEEAKLMVQALDGKGQLEVAHHLSTLGFQWMPDGCSLVFTTPMTQQGDSIQSIRRITALQATGELMKPAFERQPDGKQHRVEGADRLPEAQTLAMAIMPDRHMLQVLPDGRVLFASQPIALPLIGGGVQLDPRLYLISAEGTSIHEVPTSPGDLPTDLNYFVISPSGEHIAVVEKGTDAVALVEVSTGKTDIIAAPHAGWKCETIPAWKSATELSFAGLEGKSTTPKLLLWSLTGGTQSLSETWPADAAAQWLSAPKTEPTKTEAP